MTALGACELSTAAHDGAAPAYPSSFHHKHATAPTQFLETGGIRFAFRRFGTETGVPLVFMQHFRGGLDHWDPAITDGLARDRPVILFDNAGVAGSSGETPETVDAMGDND